MNDLKQFISQKDNALLQKDFSYYVTKGVDKFIKEKLEEWDFVMTWTEMNKEHEHFGEDFKILLMSIIYKMQITDLQNYSKDLILITDSEIMYPFFK